MLATDRGGEVDGADRRVHDRAGALALAAWLQDPDRQDPVVVVTLPPGRDRPYFDIGALARDVGSFAEIAILPTGAFSWAFSGALPARAGVFGGAARVYPPTLSWVQSLGSARVFLAGSAAEAQRHHRAVVDAAHAAAGAGLTPSPASAMADYAAGDVVPALVTRLAAADMDVSLVPGLTVEIAATDVTDDPQQAVDDLFSLDDVIAVRVITSLPWRLCVVGAEVPLTRPAPPRVAGGEPWISLATAVPAGDAPADSDPLAEPWRATPTDWRRPARPESIPLPDAGPPPALVQEAVPVTGPETTRLVAERDEARAQSRHLEAELRRAEQRRAEATGQVQQVKASLNKKIALLRDLQKQVKSGAGAVGLPRGRDLFADGEEAFRFDVYLAWATRVSAQEKDTYALPDYVVGPGFLASLEAAEGIDRAKVIEVVVEVLCGRAKETTTHAPRAYRVQPGTQNAQRDRRADGAVAFRVNLQNNTPAARRLHYWQLPDHRIELWNVADHDDHDG